MKKAKEWTRATKKKPTRPRPPPVEVLTDDQRELQAKDAEAKAAIHMREALAMSTWGDAPNACIHSAYYAMHFIAVAALLRAGGVGKRKDVPESHEHVIQHYAKLAETLPPPFTESGKLLNRARDMRVEADYFRDENGNLDFGVHGASAIEASDLTSEASSFMVNWLRRWGRAE